MEVRFTVTAHRDFVYWKKYDPRQVERIRNLCEDIALHPFEGIGKPEPLKYDFQGYWSRRIDRTHRLVYSVQDGEIIVISCRYHY